LNDPLLGRLPLQLLEDQAAMLLEYTQRPFERMEHRLSNRRGVASNMPWRATIFFDSTRCTYSGNLSGSSDGLMDCSDAGAIPLSISIK
jgi:hypothetical protein